MSGLECGNIANVLNVGGFDIHQLAFALLIFYQSTLFKIYYKELKLTYLYTKYTVKPWQTEI